MFGWIHWDPSREIFTIPLIDRAVGWYGVCFVVGFLFGYRIFLSIMLRRLASDPVFKASGEPLKETAVLFTDRVTWYAVIGTVVGARLGHVFFYGWEHYRQNPIEILKVWEGGLASHGGTVGVFLGLVYFYQTVCKRKSQITFLGCLDSIVVPTALVAFFIRLGNFFNQEIVGTESKLPWAIVFGHPAENVPAAPRHPAQLYEAFIYLGIFVLLAWLWKTRGERLKEGVLSGWFFVLIFGSRFFVEFLKVPQTTLVAEGSLLDMGQWLSIPFVAAGAWLLVRKGKRSELKVKR